MVCGVDGGTADFLAVPVSVLACPSDETGYPSDETAVAVEKW